MVAHKCARILAQTPCGTAKGLVGEIPEQVLHLRLKGLQIGHGSLPLLKHWKVNTHQNLPDSEETGVFLPGGRERPT